MCHRPFPVLRFEGELSRQSRQLRDRRYLKDGPVPMPNRPLRSPTAQRASLILDANSAFSDKSYALADGVLTLRGRVAISTPAAISVRRSRRCRARPLSSTVPRRLPTPRSSPPPSRRNG